MKLFCAVTLIYWSHPPVASQHKDAHDPWIIARVVWGSSLDRFIWCVTLPTKLTYWCKKLPVGGQGCGGVGKDGNVFESHKFANGFYETTQHTVTAAAPWSASLRQLFQKLHLYAGQLCCLGWQFVGTSSTVRASQHLTSPEALLFHLSWGPWSLYLYCFWSSFPFFSQSSSAKFLSYLLINSSSSGISKTLKI